jgi:uncharacterized protein YhdP
MRAACDAWRLVPFPADVAPGPALYLRLLLLRTQALSIRASHVPASTLSKPEDSSQAARLQVRNSRCRGVMQHTDIDTVDGLVSAAADLETHPAKKHIVLDPATRLRS